MLDYLKKQTVTITIGVSFFVFGFFAVANILHLSERDILVGLVSGAVGGITMLVMSLVEDHRSCSVSARTAVRSPSIHRIDKASARANAPYCSPGRSVIASPQIGRLTARPQRPQHKHAV